VTIRSVRETISSLPTTPGTTTSTPALASLTERIVTRGGLLRGGGVSIRLRLLFDDIHNLLRVPGTTTSTPALAMMILAAMTTVGFNPADV
jgi:hypothetical protein